MEEKALSVPGQRKGIQMHMQQKNSQLSLNSKQYCKSCSKDIEWYASEDHKNLLIWNMQMQIEKNKAHRK